MDRSGYWLLPTQGHQRHIFFARPKPGTSKRTRPYIFASNTRVFGWYMDYLWILRRDDSSIKITGNKISFWISPAPLKIPSMILCGHRRSSLQPDMFITLLVQNRIGNYSTKFIAKTVTTWTVSGVVATPPQGATPHVGQMIWDPLRSILINTFVTAMYS